MGVAAEAAASSARPSRTAAPGASRASASLVGALAGVEPELATTLRRPSCRARPRRAPSSRWTGGPRSRRARRAATCPGARPGSRLRLARAAGRGPTITVRDDLDVCRWPPRRGCGSAKLRRVVAGRRETKAARRNDRGRRRHNREHFARARLLAVNLMGSPGSGKTALLEATARALSATPAPRRRSTATSRPSATPSASARRAFRRGRSPPAGLPPRRRDGRTARSHDMRARRTSTSSSSRTSATSSARRSTTSGRTSTSSRCPSPRARTSRSSTR